MRHSTRPAVGVNAQHSLIGQMTSDLAVIAKPGTAALGRKNFTYVADWEVQRETEVQLDRWCWRVGNGSNSLVLMVVACLEVQIESLQSLVQRRLDSDAPGPWRRA